MFALQETTIVGISGIIGTLLGTLIGAGVTLWVQMTQRKHEDRTRFHEERLRIYAEYTDAANKVMAALATGHDHSPYHGPALRAFETLRLVASPPVRDAANIVNAIVGAAATAQQLPPVPQVLPPTFNSALRALCDAMRAEIGVE